jgi:hypothetical protein
LTDVSDLVGIDDDGTGKGLLVFDYDQDGDLDLFIVNNASGPVLYRNDMDNGNHWLRVKPRGRYSNRDGIGSVVTIVSGDGASVQHREISGGSHYLTQSEKVAHFGLGISADPIQRLKVRWPSGIEQEFFDVAVDQVLEVIEPESPFQAWLVEHFSKAELFAGVVVDRQADPDGDGLNNSLEFGLGLDPKKADSSQPIEVLSGSAKGKRILRYQARSLPRGLGIRIEKSEDLQDWKACDSSDLEVFSAEETDDWGVKIFAARLLGNLPVKYLRLRVILED